MARSYITASDFRALPLGVPLRQYTDEVIENYIEVATQNVENFCERIFESDEYAETFVGDWTSKFLVQNYPITAIDSITYTNISSGETGTLDVATLIRSDVNDASGIVELYGSAFAGDSLYVITYTAGYVDLPPAVKHATAVWVSELIKPDFGGVSSDVPEVVPFSSQQIVELLTPFRRRRL